jgi:hypothetical protein
MSLIPEHLRSLPVWRGLPVPYVAMWSSEDEASFVVRPDPLYGDREALFPGTGGIGQGEAVLGNMNCARQRETLAKGQCQVCRRRVAGGRGYVVLSETTSRQIVTESGVATRVITEPWLCRRCLEFASETCPGLIRRRRDDDLTILRPTKWVIGASSGWVEGALEEHTKAHNCLMWGELHVLAAITVEALSGSGKSENLRSRVTALSGGES